MATKKPSPSERKPKVNPSCHPISLIGAIRVIKQRSQEEINALKRAIESTPVGYIDPEY